MNKFYILILSLTFALSEVQAQSETYQIEILSKPEKLLPKVYSDSLFKNIDKDFVKLSVTDSLADFGTHPVMLGYLKAYQSHYPITISPDIAWLLICQGFANHVNHNPEKLRSKIAGFEGKKTLTVQRIVKGPENLVNLQWETLFPEFAEQITRFTGKELIDNLSADFTTTTPTALVTSQITIMESMKEFFNYKVTLIGCGIPAVTVEGSVEDWKKILTRLDYLSTYDLEWWTSELKPVIQKIIDTKEGKLDKQFWMNMVKYHKLGVYGYDGIDGWLLKFYPYLQGSAPPVVEKRGSTENKPTNIEEIKPKDIVTVKPKDIKVKPTDIFLVNTKNTAYKTRTLYLRQSEFKEIKSVDVLPKELANVPFVVEVQDDDGTIKQTFKMEFWAGFMGLKQDSRSFNVKPEIGWAVNRKM